MSYVLTFLAGMVFSAIAILASMVDDDSDELWCGCDGEGMAHTLGAKGFACAADTAPQPAQDDHDEDCPCHGDEVQHAPDCNNCECAPSKPVQGQENL